MKHEFARCNMESSLLYQILLCGTILLATVVLILYLFEKRTNRQLAGKVAAMEDVAAFHQERLTVLSEAAFEGIVLLEDGVCLLMNSRAEDIFGYRSNEIVGLPTTVLIARQDRQLVQDNIAHHFNEPYEVIGQRKDGSLFPLAIYGKSLEYQGRIVRAAALRDLTLWKKRDAERIVLEEQLRRSQKMESIGLMAGGVAHDLNNILSGLVTYPELLLLNMPEADPLHDPLKAMQKAGERAAEVVADLLTVARGVAMVMRPENLNCIADNYLQSPEFEKLAKSHPSVSFEWELAQDLPAILGSAVHVGKCLMNLVTNGAESIQGEGKVHVRTYRSKVNEQRAEELQLEAGQYSVLAVGDSGTGISQEDMEHIFEPFYSRKVIGRSGTGLGLAVVWNTMQDHNGSVQLQSDRYGSCFMLYFPVTDKVPEFLEPDDDIGFLVGNGESILIVDDEPHQLAIAGQILSNLNYKVEKVESGEKAILWLEENSADLLILDMMMGQGMNGYETYAKAVQRKPGQKALIASGFSESDEVVHTLRLGAGLFIKKPYAVAQLGRAVRKVLQGEDACPV